MYIFAILIDADAMHFSFGPPDPTFWIQHLGRTNNQMDRQHAQPNYIYNGSGCRLVQLPR